MYLHVLYMQVLIVVDLALIFVSNNLSFIDILSSQLRCNLSGHQSCIDQTENEAATIFQMQLQRRL